MFTLMVRGVKIDPLFAAKSWIPLMRKMMIAVAMSTMLTTVAHATVTYTLTDQVYGGESPNRLATVSFSLAVSDAAVARGSLFIPRASSGQGSGDLADLQYLSFVIGPADSGTITADTLVRPGEFLSTSLSLTSTTAIGSLEFGGSTSEVHLFGGSGPFGTDANNCYNGSGNPRCFLVSSRMVGTIVPEPTSLGLLAAGVIGLTMRRLRRAASISSVRLSPPFLLALRDRLEVRKKLPPQKAAW